MKRLIIIYLALLLLAANIAACTAAEEPAGDTARGGVVLVLSGGGTRGFAHVGVLKVLEEQGVPIVGIVGTSIGSVIGGIYATGTSADELRDIILNTDIMALLADSGTRSRPNTGAHRPIGEMTDFIHTTFDDHFHKNGPLGILQAQSLISFLDKTTGNIRASDFMDFPIPFACVATDIATGEAVVLRSGSLSSAIRASVSIPGLLEPWKIDGRMLVDGGLVANLPVDIARELFPGYPVLAVNLTGESISKSQEEFSSTIDVLLQAIDVMTIDRIRQNESHADLVIHPDLKGFTMLDRDGYDKIYERGLAAADAKRADITALSAAAPAAPDRVGHVPAKSRIIRAIRVDGLRPDAAADIERAYAHWIGFEYDAERVGRAVTMLVKRDDISEVNVGLEPYEGGGPDDVELVLAAEKRPKYEMSLGGYSTNVHRRRWVEFNAAARDLAAEGDSAGLTARWGNDEWDTSLRYFSPLNKHGQWGFAISAGRDKHFPAGEASYQLERYAARLLHYFENINSRIGIGVGAMKTNDAVHGDIAWGPYFYLSSDTLDDARMPTKGYSVNSRVWWNSDSVWVSNTNVTAYMPLMSDTHLLLRVGMKTGKGSSRVYRAYLGSEEELYSTSRSPLWGDQAAWAHLGIGRIFANSWWGSLRGELFGAYGMVMDDWSKKDSAWEAGLALSSPGRFLDAKIFAVYGDNSEFMIGFSIGDPRWWPRAMP